MTASPLTVRYHAHHLELSGYGRAAAGYIAALGRAAGAGEVQIEVQPVVTPSSDLEEVDIAIYHTTPARLATVRRHPAQKHVALTTWETQPMPMEHLKTLWSFDAVIVPSAFCRDLAPSGRADRDVYVVPHGFDPAFWTPDNSNLQMCKDDVFTFYSIGAWGERKNTLGLLKAYLHAFTKADRTRLVLIVDKVNFTAIHSLLARSGIPQSELPGLVIPDQRLTDDEILKLHRESDCFVTATRAEGFGLPIFEAAIMGKPVISPRWGGQAEFLDGYLNGRIVWNFLTPVFSGEDEVQVDGNRVTVSTTLARGATCKQIWAEPSLDRLSWEMRGVVLDHREGLLKDDHSRREWFEENYSYDAIGVRFLDTLKEILR